jgi:hypothetical protein
VEPNYHLLGENSLLPSKKFGFFVIYNKKLPKVNVRQIVEKLAKSVHPEIALSSKFCYCIDSIG